MLSIYVEETWGAFDPPESYSFSKCELLNYHSFICCDDFTDVAYWFTHSGSIFKCVRSFAQNTCCNPSMLQMHLPGHPTGSLPRKDDWDGCVTTGTPVIQSPEPEHMALAVRTEPHGIQPSQITGFIWFRFMWAVLQVVLTLTSVRSLINLSTPQVNPDPKMLKVKLPAKQWLNFELKCTVTEASDVRLWWASVR